LNGFDIMPIGAGAGKLLPRQLSCQSSNVDAPLRS
jgi:hypothetical protein